ncbi:MAG: hypothetical protein MRERV_64c013 [Mycoplasmataceae bacterium RV_VA103A]|nr:MAG: hypothetical protein MRERV_64c013 [Mycoplasmataceae bacterium RV_VA103A]
MKIFISSVFFYFFQKFLSYNIFLSTEMLFGNFS